MEAIMLLIIYFIPTMLACKRGCIAQSQIFLVNLFFGWTAVGWIVALIWANSPNVEES